MPVLTHHTFGLDRGEARAVTAIRRYKGDICGSVVAVLRTGFALPAPGCTFDS